MTSADLSDLCDLPADNVASFPFHPLRMGDFGSTEPEGPEPGANPRRRYRTVWISDVHLGTRGCNADLLIDFLDNVDSETMYLSATSSTAGGSRRSSTGPPRTTTSSGAS